jgi:hypothetical protein
MATRICSRRLSTDTHLNNLFPPLQFPPELSTRLLTHGSHKSATTGHNSRFSFIGMFSQSVAWNNTNTHSGRRVLESYLLLFLQSSPSLNHTHDLDLISSRTLNTHILGEHVAPKWDLGRVLRWAPPVPTGSLNLNHAYGQPSAELHPATARSVGLYKVLGEAVQAVVGGVFHQFVSLSPFLPTN